MKKHTTLQSQLNKHFSFIIIFALLLTAVFITFFNSSHLIENEKKSMSESLRQAQINIQNHMVIVDDYLSIAIANPILQKQLQQVSKFPPASQVAIDLNELNEMLLSIDLFKKSIDTVSLFVYDGDRHYPSFQRSNYSNAVFTTTGMDDEDWFIQTEKADGRTYWFIDENTPGGVSVCAARLVPDCSKPSNIMGMLRINISIAKYIHHFKDISFGSKGFVQLSTETRTFQVVEEDHLIVSIQNTPLQSRRTHIEISYPIASTNWVINGYIANNTLFANALTNLLLIFIVFGVTTVVATWLCVQYSKKISMPLSNLSRKMGSMRKIAPASDDTCQEIEDLYSTYNGMLEQMDALASAREQTLQALRQAELSALQEQMNPHFLYNTLESVNSLIATSDNQNALQMVGSLASFLRSTLNSREPFITLEKEIAHVRAYFDIQQIRYQNRIRLVLDVPPTLPTCKVTKFILQPLVENCILHGFQEINYVGEVTLRVRDEDAYLRLIVEDNGLGSDMDFLNDKLLAMEPAANPQEKFNCIRNIQRRIIHCYGEKSGLRYEENESGGVTAIITIEKKRLAQTSPGGQQP